MKPLRIMLLALVCHGAFAQQGPNGPGTAATSGSTSYNWSNSSNVLTDNSSAATAVIVGKGSFTNTLRLTNFGFTLPGGATVNGILVEVRMQGSNGKTRDHTIQLRKAAGPVGTNKARKKGTWPRKAPRYIQFGSSTDLWGTTWSQVDINNTAFGIDIVAKSKKQTTNTRVEYVRITVYYNQSKYYSKSTGNLNVLGSWGPNTDGTGTAPANFTNANQIFTLRNRATYSLNTNLTISGSGSKMVVGDGSSSINFTIPSGFSYTGLLDVANNATLTLNNSTIPTLGQIARTSNGGASTVVYGASTAQSIDGRAFHNLTVSGTGLKTLSGTGSAEGKLTINAGATISDGGYIFTVEGELENSGTHQSGADGVLVLEGDATQSITGTSGSFGNIEILNANGVNLSNSITVNGDLFFSEGALSIGTSTLTLTGTVTNDIGTLSGGNSSNLVVNGTGALGTLNFTSGSQTLNNLTINRTSTGLMTLGTPLTVRTTLTMTAGNIVNGSNGLTLGTSTSSRGTLSRTAGIITGSFTRWFTNATNSGTTGLFPIGTSTDYRPAQIEFTTGPSTGGRLTAQFVSSDPGNAGLPLSESSVNLNKAGESGVWELTATTLSGGLYTGTFTATSFGGVLDYTTLHLLKRTNSGTNWTLNGTHQATTGSNSAPILRRTGMSNFGQFGVGGDEAVNPLPVELLFFTVLRQENQLLFHWATATEINNDFFDLEKSLDGKEWTLLARLDGNGNTDKRMDYYYNAVAPNLSAYYRLKQVDFDGDFEIHRAIFENNQNPLSYRKLSVTPNPVKSGTKLKIESQIPQEEIQRVTLTTVEGKQITQLAKSELGIEYVLPKISGQIYILMVQTNFRTYAQRVIVQSEK